VFCDLHCIRNAVEQGDKTIIDSITHAVQVIGTNTHSLMEHVLKTLQIEMKVIDVKLGRLGRKKRSLIEEASAIHEDTGRMLMEMYHLATETSYDAHGKASINRALDALAGFSAHVTEGNLTNITSTFQSLNHQTQTVLTVMKIAAQNKMNQASVIGHRVAKLAVKMQDAALSQNKLLGVFTKTSAVSKERQRLLRDRGSTLQGIASELDHLGAQMLLLQMDDTWWKLRSEIDKYLEVVSAQAKTYAELVSVMDAYTSECSATYPMLQVAYSNAVNAEQAAHRVLREVWISAVPLIGLLASQVCDGDAFQRFARIDAAAVAEYKLLDQTSEVSSNETLSLSVRDICGGSNAAVQTVQTSVIKALEQGLLGQLNMQLSVLLAEMETLAHRHAWANLGVPVDMEQIVAARDRMVQSRESMLRDMNMHATQVLAAIRSKHGCTRM